MTRGQDRAMKPAKPADRSEQETANWWEYCPVCGSKLRNEKCRYICSDSRCQYFMSCSEFDL